MKLLDAYTNEPIELDFKIPEGVVIPENVYTPYIWCDTAEGAEACMLGKKRCPYTNRKPKIIEHPITHKFRVSNVLNPKRAFSGFEEAEKVLGSRYGRKPEPRPEIEVREITEPVKINISPGEGRVTGGLFKK